MSIPSVGSGHSVSEIARALSRAFDAPGAQRSQSGTFGALLDGVVGQQRPLDGDLGTAATAVTMHRGTTVDAAPGGHPLATPSANPVGDERGSYARSLSSLIASLGLAPVPGNLQVVVEHARSNGFEHARAVGQDGVDLGDGRGAVGLINNPGGAHASWWFNGGAHVAR